MFEDLQDSGLHRLEIRLDLLKRTRGLVNIEVPVKVDLVANLPDFSIFCIPISGIPKMFL